MKFRNKITALAAALTVMSGSLQVSALDFSFKKEKTVDIDISECYAQENDIAQVTIDLRSNPGISAFSLELRFDPKLLAFESAQGINATSRGNFYCNGDYMEDSIKLVWSDSSNFFRTGDIAVVNFRTRNSTAETEADIGLGYSEVCNSDLENFKIESDNGVVKITDEQLTGDVDLNGSLEVNDVVFLNKFILDSKNTNIETFTAMANADVDKDGSIDSSDSSLMINTLSGLK